MAIALHHSRARNSTMIAILVGIANHAGDGGAWPTVGTLAHYARVKDRAVQYALTDLEKLGEIRRDIQSGGTVEIAHFDRPNLYHFILCCPPHCDRTASHKLICQGCKKALPKTSQLSQFHPQCNPVHPVQADAPGATECTGPVQPRAPKPSLELKPTLNENALELKRESAREEPKSERQSRTTNSSDVFDIKSAIERATAPRPADEPLLDACPKRTQAPHAYTRAGECIDCGAQLIPGVNIMTGEIE